jgi:hypothetical protein
MFSNIYPKRKRLEMCKLMSFCMYKRWSINDIIALP